MGGKRPDQYRIAPAEGRATDYKYYPESTHGQDKDLSTEADKQRLAESRNDPKGQPFLPDIAAPSVHANRGRRPKEDEPGADETETGKENPPA